MSNLTDFIGGKSSIVTTKLRGIEQGVDVLNRLTDGTNSHPKAVSKYYAVVEYENLINSFSISFNNEDLPSTLFDARYFTSYKVMVPNGSTLKGNLAGSFIGIEANEMKINGIIDVSGDIPTSERNLPLNAFCGIGGKTKGGGSSGSNPLKGVWNFMPKGGDSGQSVDSTYGTYAKKPGGVGFSGGSPGNVVGTDFTRDSIAGGNGGGLCLLIADKIIGNGKIDVSGQSGVYSQLNGNTGYSGDGGGGMIIIITKEWNNKVTLDVRSKHSSNSGPGTEGSYIILRPDGNSNLTVLCHSENGKSAVINGQTPIFGKFSNVPFDSTTRLSPNHVTAGTSLTIAVGKTAYCDSVAVHIGDNFNSNSPYLSYTSSDTSIATVDSNGNVTGVAKGSCIITATSIIDSKKSNTTNVKIS